MENVYKTIGNLCAFSYLIGILLNIVNIKSNKNIVKLVLTLYVIAMVITPLKNIEIYPKEFLIDDNYYFIESNDEYIIQQAELLLENQIKNELNSKNISYKEIVMHIINNEDGVKIDEINITGTKNSERDIISSLLKNYTDNKNIHFGE